MLEVKDLRVRFAIRLKQGLFGRRVPLDAVDGVSFSLSAGETLGIVGESGCGKSTLARAVLQLLPAHEGKVSWLGTQLTDLDRREMTARRKDLQIVFQDPLARPKSPHDDWRVHCRTSAHLSTRPDLRPTVAHAWSR